MRIALVGYGKMGKAIEQIAKDKGHSIFVSEYDAPKDFKCIWEKKMNTAINHEKTKKATEKLFTL